MSGALERTRTSDLQVRNLLLYPLSYERAWGLLRIPLVSEAAGVRRDAR